MLALPRSISLLPWDAPQGTLRLAQAPALTPRRSVLSGLGTMDGAWYCCQRSGSALLVRERVVGTRTAARGKDRSRPAL